LVRCCGTPVVLQAYLHVHAPLLVEWIAEELDAILNLETLPRTLVQAILCAEHRHACKAWYQGEGCGKGEHLN
jgi:hypothetical protein